MTSRFINAYVRSGDIHITSMPKYCSATLEILSSTIMSPWALTWSLTSVSTPRTAQWRRGMFDNYPVVLNAVRWCLREGWRRPRFLRCRDLDRPRCGSAAMRPRSSRITSPWVTTWSLTRAATMRTARRRRACPMSNPWWRRCIQRRIGE